jgi:Rv0078B-related antitoxin
MDRLQAALDLFAIAEAMLRQRLRRERPDATEAEIEAAVMDWSAARPGGEPGDAPGHQRPWPPA